MSKEKYSAEQIEKFISKIGSKVEKFRHGVQDNLQDNIVMVLGASGSGKSTVLNIIAQKKFEIKKEKGTWGLDVIGKEYAGEITAEGFKKMSIGYGGDSKTKFPNYIMAGDTQFWDCPGFNDNRHPHTEVSNMYCVYHMISHIMSKENNGGIKFIIVESSDGTTSGGESFRNTINNLCELFPSKSPKDLIAATTFIFTKVGPNEQQGNGYLIDVLDRVSVKENEANKKVVDFLSAMRKNLDTINHFEIPKVTRSSDSLEIIPSNLSESLLNKVLNQGESIKNSEIGFVMSDSAYLIVQKLEKHWQEDIADKCKSLTPILKQIFEEIEKTQGKEVIKAKIDDLFQALNVDKEALKNGGATSISLNLISKLTELSPENQTYQNMLKNITQSIKSIEFVGAIALNKICGANFINIIASIEEGGNTYLNEMRKHELQQKSSEIEKYINNNNYSEIIEKALLVAGGLGSIGGGIALSVLMPDSAEASAGTLIPFGVSLLGAAFRDVLKNNANDDDKPLSGDHEHND